MKTGTILLIPFPFTEHTGAKKVRPSVLVCETADAYKDLVVCAISSVVPLAPDALNQLRKPSVLKVDRIVTVKAKDVIAQLGELSPADEATFRSIFHSLI
ncbi:MAG: type II toxin-antitoxin system PemK/MazF family toxin [Saprospiraceae bacterium]